MKYAQFPKMGLLAMLAVLVINAGMILSTTSCGTGKLQQSHQTMEIQPSGSGKIHYKFVHIPLDLFGGFSDADVEKIVQQNTSQGWELVQVIEGHAVVIFKR